MRYSWVVSLLLNPLAQKLEHCKHNRLIEEILAREKTISRNDLDDKIHYPMIRLLIQATLAKKPCLM